MKIRHAFFKNMRAKRATTKAAKPRPDIVGLCSAVIGLCDRLDAVLAELRAARIAEPLGEGTVQTAPPPESAPAAKGWQIPVLPYLRNMVRTDNHMVDVGE